MKLVVIVAEVNDEPGEDVLSTVHDLLEDTDPYYVCNSAVAAADYNPDGDGWEKAAEIVEAWAENVQTWNINPHSGLSED